MARVPEPLAYMTIGAVTGAIYDKKRLRGALFGGFIGAAIYGLTLHLK